jgi:hypothetical protein
VAEIRQREDGGWELRRAGRQSWEPISEARRQAEHEGFLSSFGRSVATGGEALVRGGADLLNRTVGSGPELMESIFGPQATGQVQTTPEENRAALEAARTRLADIGEAAPYASLGQYAPEAVMGGAGRGLAGVTAIEAGLGAARNPEAPIRGAATGAVFGGLGYGAGMAIGVGTRRGLAMANAATETARRMASRGRFVPGEAAAAAGPRPRSVGAAAAETVGPAGALERRSLQGMLTPDEVASLADELGFDAGLALRASDAAALTAREGTGELAAAEAGRQADELLRSSPVNDALYGNISGTRELQGEMANRLIMREVSDNSMDRLTAENMRNLRQDLGAVFDDAAEQVGDFRFDPGDLDDLDEIVASSLADDQALLARHVGAVKADLKENVLANQTALERRSKLGKDIRRAAGSGQYERAQALGEVQDVLDRIVDRQAPPKVQEQLRDARYRYRIYKALERSTATTDPGGKVNLRSFNTAYQRGNRFYRGSVGGGVEGRGKQFARQLETLRYLTEKVVPSSGTSERMLANLAPGALRGIGTAGAAGGGLLGLDALLGE